MPNENDERERGAPAISNQPEKAVEKDDGMRSALHPPSAPNAAAQRHLGDDTMDESPGNSTETGTAASDLPPGHRENAATKVIELASETQEQSVAVSGGVHHAATECDVADSTIPSDMSPNQHTKKQGSPSSVALSAKPAKEKASPSSDAGSPKSSKLLGKSEGRRTTKAPGTASLKATTGRNSEPDPKPAFLLKHQLFHHPRHKKATATDSPRGVKAATPTGEATRASGASKKRPLPHGPALDPSLKRKLIEGPESSIVVEGSVAQHVLNRIGKLKHKAVPSSALYGSKDDREGRAKELGAAASERAKVSNRVTLREVIGPASSHEEPLFRVTAGPFRGLIGQWMCFTCRNTTPCTSHALWPLPQPCRDWGRGIIVGRRCFQRPTTDYGERR